ncbi:nonpathogenic pore-forming peptide precursor, putative [Entamoeba histolytica HM-1:IMSS-B]|uniref:Nonpathogenic pore-forming peptide, putative n=6 Tax=Entamoeba histolytica TaxID=5759 RepID=C4M251_ENTH1|nr:nonpathogenic pore-forming peptide precursor, putative [Entamoeba histolytica HM-1:IMSS]EMD43237.1 nonpathogenic pore-forming peptide precursor, putative [Entamoeba histolytica KU27]EMH73505.1 nonpathogenic pore-forming peptide precursor, putative [Entamoeba histolytica HM-1:IMSS-B]EMS14609.1 nonpathogenic pore-forming peptide precursor, putative [Entamoeba histolytica HM-3:IMSS]ENY64049.1 nonpathogenic pore-forming peptide precursor, putative [Entamoeba histolytica HM-1:IMSS-A]GAT95341.1 n|eukprot:XP_655836.1 nonpathogenic pore-forming peptide precursor, putative [Entamoeba histolytica HM-1:IMSS]
MRAFLIVLLISFAVAGPIVCNLCIGLVNTLDGLIVNKGADRVKNYIDDLCGKADGFIAQLCEKLLSFGLDKLIDLIQSKVDPNAICAQMNAC